MGVRHRGKCRAEKEGGSVFEMSCLRPIRGVTMWERMRNEHIRMGCGFTYKLSERVNQSIIIWYGHMDRMSEERLVKRISRAEENRAIGRGRSRTRWRNGVRKVLGEKDMTIQHAERCVKYR